ncbi:MAG: TerD family protein [Moraxellaceae bacterium]|jgi:tellurium resistance protein TerD|nr:TerD family protein [Moraxellaceae bacterium]HQV80007.1 TerD family protein [Agitococcus sp.]MBK7299768.1 TerD family protein [Moraxellaceae bacterium]MBK8325658.1 TerD family protein [Moraxellaceae bacterium]MBK9185629.1 TerD family protein [Moraxellaceae bacterium]
MAISLTKGGNVNLSKEAPTMTKMVVGLGWDTRATDGAAFDLDAVAFVLKADGKVRADGDFIFFNNKQNAEGSVAHGGDNRTGEGEGDDESVMIDFSKMPADIEKVAICVTIYDADTRRQNFGQVSRAYVRVLNEANQQEIARYDLSEDGSTETAMIFGEIYRHSGEWKFKAIGQGFKGGLAPLAASYGVNV